MLEMNMLCWLATGCGVGCEVRLPRLVLLQYMRVAGSTGGLLFEQMAVPHRRAACHLSIRTEAVHSTRRGRSILIGMQISSSA